MVFILDFTLNQTASDSQAKVQPDVPVANSAEVIRVCLSPWLLESGALKGTYPPEGSELNPLKSSRRRNSRWGGAGRL